MDNAYLNGYAKIFGPVGTAIYVSLCRHADNDGQKSHPSQKRIAGELAIGTTVIKKYLRDFEEWRLIYIERRKDTQTKRQLVNIYWLLDKSEWRKPEENNEFIQKPGTLSGKAGVAKCPRKAGVAKCPISILNNNNNNNSNTVNFETFIEQKLGKLATMERIREVLEKMPQVEWRQVERFLRERYPLNGARAFQEAKRGC